MRRSKSIRSLLAVAATSRRHIEKASQSVADAVFIDLEDAVIPVQKEAGRHAAIEAINELDWGTRTVCVRVNGLATAWGCRDILDVVEACPRLDAVLLPKCETPEDAYAAQVLIASGETSRPRERQACLWGLIETARGIANVDRIADRAGKLEALVFGGGDYSLDLGRVQVTIGGPSGDYAVLTDPNERGDREVHWNDQWHFAMAKIANAGRAYGLQTIDGPYSKITDTAGLVSATRRAGALGFSGKMAIHPAQIESIHRVLTPTDEQIVWAESVIAAMAKAASEGRGAVKDKNGEMIDLVHIKIANQLMDRVKRIRGN